LIYSFWLLLWYLWFTASDYSCGNIFDLRLLITPVVSLIYDFWLLLWYLWFMASDYTCGIFDIWLLITPVVSLIYCFWLLLWYLQTLLTPFIVDYIMLCLRLKLGNGRNIIHQCFPYINVITWSIAQGMRQGMLLLPLNISGNDELKLGAAWMEGKLILPIQVLSSNPNMPFTWLNVTNFCTRHIFL
jgi:hypothetical protein